ncbi:hypothetical protein [Amphritea balenae]|uniref:Uncharacterized protein n=1 Tax=Amphritea balenae TaxID=452629 RepID=A0A3P1SR08_9GAMM|nr:hypothetical protein [Amphritea balenae]RRC99344.1 hypothetical protein EHS89_10905 [Amphritea balenae]
MKTDICSAIAQKTHQQWNLPSSLVGGGHDARSSTNGLLTIFYGNLERAAQFGWLNAGRTLVDKTYLSILWQAAELNANGYDFTKMASNLDAFVRAELEPRWLEFEQLSHDEKHLLTIDLIEQAAAEIFGSGYHEQSAAWLIFFLCPQLPVFPITADLQHKVSKRLHCEQPAEDYAGYHQQCRQLFCRMLPHIHDSTLKATYGSERDRNNVNQVLRGSDWWQRYCFIEQLKK